MTRPPTLPDRRKGAVAPLLVVACFWLAAGGCTRPEAAVGVARGTDAATLRQGDTTRAPAPDLALRGRLAIDGRRFVYPDGRQFHWRGVTAFRLLDYVADGEEEKADAFLRWARRSGFNLVRVLGSLCCWFDLTPDAAQAAMPRLLDMAARRDLYVEVVALAGTRERAFDLVHHVRAIGEVCGRADNCLVQIANEPYHPTQDKRLSRTEYLQELANLLPESVLYTLGASRADKTHEPAGRYITRHLSRGDDAWKMAARVRDLELLSAETGRPVVNGEPIGAADRNEPGRRSDDPAVFFGLGLLGRLFDVGTTFHAESGLHAVVPGPVQQRCADAFIEGTRLIPDDVRPEFQNATWPASPVRTARFGRDVWKVYSGVNGTRGWTVALGVTRDPGIVWANGWTPSGVVAEKPGIRVYAIARREHARRPLDDVPGRVRTLRILSTPPGTQFRDLPVPLR